ncbi:18338_t:CDS:2 [Gigaspora rosea]|nr:18338_t:CDS:2 [Gigaspora rosea]
MEQYSGNKMEITIPPERLEIWILATYWLPMMNPLRITEADAIQLGLDQRARVIIKLGQANSYWKSKDMVKQFHEKAITIFNFLHPEYIDIV